MVFQHEQQTWVGGVSVSNFFVFDVESVGLHGEGFAVAGGVYLPNGSALWEFQFACPIGECVGNEDDMAWVKYNVPTLEITHRSPYAMRDDFWRQWMKAKAEGAVMATDCGWPVEAGFLKACIADNLTRKWDGPYPLHEIASYLASAGMDPLEKYERLAGELPVHHPLCDARQSARLLSIALGKIGGAQCQP